MQLGKGEDGSWDWRPPINLPSHYTTLDAAGGTKCLGDPKGPRTESRSAKRGGRQLGLETPHQSAITPPQYMNVGVAHLHTMVEVEAMHL
jgi:hypothetical protein